MGRPARNTPLPCGTAYPNISVLIMRMPSGKIRFSLQRGVLLVVSLARRDCRYIDISKILCACTLASRADSRNETRSSSIEQTRETLLGLVGAVDKAGPGMRPHCKGLRSFSSLE